jgi:hypothetical protein
MRYLTTVPIQAQRINQCLLGILCALATGAVHLEPLKTSLADRGKARLQDLFAEKLDFIKTKGGPYIDQRAALRVEPFFIDSCPHCGSMKPKTDDEEDEISRTIQGEAEKGVPQAQFQLAGRYMQGKGIIRDFAQGLHWLTNASDNGVIRATSILAAVYDEGINVPVDHQRAAQFYGLTAADPNSAYSEHARQRLAEMNEFGIGIPKNYAKAMALYKSGPVLSNFTTSRPSPKAEFAIGRMYAQGKGVPKDYALAAQWFLNAADKGTGYGGSDTDAECALAIMYWSGVGVQRDLQRSLVLLKRPNVKNLKECHYLNTEIGDRD